MPQSTQGCSVVYNVAPSMATPFTAAYHGVLLGVNRAAELLTFTGRDLHLVAQAAYVEGPRHAARRTVVSRRQDAAVAHQHGADLAPQTGGARRGLAGELQE